MTGSYTCQGDKLPPRVFCVDMSILDLDDLLPNPIYKVQKADCLVLCGKFIKWIIERKKKSLKDIIDQFESTIDTIVSRMMTGNTERKLEMDNQSLHLLVISQNGIGGEKLFELDLQQRLKRRGEDSYLKVKNRYSITVLTRRQIEDEIRSQGMWDQRSAT
jgi:hypothetical protein